MFFLKEYNKDRDNFIPFRRVRNKLRPINDTILLMLRLKNYNNQVELYLSPSHMRRVLKCKFKINY